MLRYFFNKIQWKNHLETISWKLSSAHDIYAHCDEYGCQSDFIINDNAEVIHKIARQPGTFVIFQNFSSGDYHNFNENQQFWRVNRWEKDALVVDCYDYDSDSEFVSLL